MSDEYEREDVEKALNLMKIERRITTLETELEEMHHQKEMLITGRKVANFEEISCCSNDEMV